MNENDTHKLDLEYVTKLVTVAHLATKEDIYQSKEDLRKEFIARADKLEAKFDSKFDKLETRLDRLDARIDRLDAKFDRFFYWIIGGFATLIIPQIIFPLVKFFTHTV